MKNKLILISVIFILLIGSVISYKIGININRFQTDKYISLHQNNNYAEKKNNELSESVARLHKYENNEETFDLYITDYIEAKKSMCTETADSTDKETVCNNIAESDWYDGIHEIITVLKPELKKEDYKLLSRSQKIWEELRKKDFEIIAESIKNKSSDDSEFFRYQASGDYEQYTKSRALFLEYIYNPVMKKTGKNYKKNKTITFDDFLDIEVNERFKNSKFSKKGEVIYKDKIVLNSKGIPLSDKTAMNTAEIKIIFGVKGIKPRDGCDTGDTLTNGTFGCYIDNPDEINDNSF